MSHDGAAIAGPPSADGSARSLSLQRLRVAWFDRALPERAGPFLAVVAAAAIACWVAGLLLADDRARFLASREWQVQPLYLAVHLVVVRLFVTAYAGGFLSGCRALDMPPAEAERRSRLVLGPAGVAAALVVAAPLAVLDVLHVRSTDFVSATATGSGAVGPADWLLVGIWTVEWIANAYIWVLIAGLLRASLHALAQHRFRDPVTKVLRERQYRPFLLMSSRGATVVLGFTAANALYVLYAGGEMSDAIGLGITVGLLLLAFVPPWMRLRQKITALVREETDRLGRQVEATFLADDEDAPAVATPRTTEKVGERVETLFALLRIQHLERLHEDLGRIEAQQVLLRLLAPAATVAWRLVRGG